MEASSQTPNLTQRSDGTNMLNIFLQEEHFKTKIYPCGGTYIYMDVTLRGSLSPPCLRYAQASLLETVIDFMLNEKVTSIFTMDFSSVLKHTAGKTTNSLQNQHLNHISFKWLQKQFQ